MRIRLSLALAITMVSLNSKASESLMDMESLRSSVKSFEVAFTVSDATPGVSEQIANCQRKLGGEGWVSDVFERNAIAYREAADCLGAIRDVIAMSRARAGFANDTDSRNLAAATSLQLQTLEARIAALNAAGDSQEGSKNFMNLSWGIGFGVSLASRKLITEASTDDGGIVRAAKEQHHEPRAILEFHNYGLFSGRARAAKGETAKTGWSPFIAVVAASGDVLQGVGGGLMVGRSAGSGSDGTGFSVGIGAILDKGVRALPKNIKVDQPLPEGESIRYVERSRWSTIVFATRTF